MAQPNIPRLVDAFTTASTSLASAGQECALLPNIPAISGTQALEDLINRRFNETRNQINELRTETRNQINELRTETRNQINELRTETRNQINELRTEMTSRFNTSEVNMMARLHNSGVKDPRAELQALQDREGVEIGRFPKNGEAVSNLSPADLRALLVRCNLPSDGDKSQMKRRFAQFAGITMVAW